MPQPLYENVGSLPLYQDVPLHPLVALNSNYAARPYVYLPTVPVYHHQPMPTFIDVTQSLHHPPLYSPGHYPGLANGILSSFPQTGTRFPGVVALTLQYADSALEEQKIEDQGQRASAVTASSNDNESASNKSELLAKPKRPLSAYNLFFQAQRQQLIQNDGDDPDRKRKRSGISFENLAKEISERWRQVDAETLRHYEDLASGDKERYQKQMKRFKEQQDSEMTKRRMDLESTVPEETRKLYLKSQAKKPKKRKKADH